MFFSNFAPIKGRFHKIFVFFHLLGIIGEFFVKHILFENLGSSGLFHPQIREKVSFIQINRLLITSFQTGSYDEFTFSVFSALKNCTLYMRAFLWEAGPARM